MQADAGGEADPRRWRGEGLSVRLDFGGGEEAAKGGYRWDNISSRSTPLLLQWSVGSCFRTRDRRGICITKELAARDLNGCVGYLNGFAGCFGALTKLRLKLLTYAKGSF